VITARRAGFAWCCRSALAAWLLLGWGCGSSETDPGTARIRVAPDLELSFNYPAGWTYERDGDMLVFKARKGPDAAVPTLFVQTRRIDSGWDLSREVSKTLAQHRQEAQSTVEEEGWLEVMESPAYRFTVRFSMASTAYKMVQQVISRGGRFFYFSYVAPADAFDGGRPAFDLALATLGFGPPAADGGASPARRDGSSLSWVRETLASAYYGAVVLAALALAVLVIRRRRKAELGLDVRARHLSDPGLLHVEVSLVNHGRRRIAMRRRGDPDSDGQLERRQGVALGLELREVRAPVDGPVTWVELEGRQPPVDLLGNGASDSRGEGVTSLVLAPGQRETLSAVLPLEGPGAVLVRAYLVGRGSGEIWERVVAVPLEKSLEARIWSSESEV